jgi:hypothetical protein
MRALFAAAALLLARADAGSGEASSRRELAAGLGAATGSVAGAVLLRLRVQSADVEIAEGPAGKVSAALADKPAARVRLVAYGSRLEVEFDGSRQLREGKLRLELPRGSSVDISSVAGNVSVRGLDGDVRVRGLSGRVQIAGAKDVDIETVDGEVRAESSGAARVHTVSGNTTLSSRSAGARAEVETASGFVDWQGACGRGCHLDIDSVSGAVSLSFDRGSSFAFTFATHDGQLKDGLGLAHRARPKQGQDTWMEAVQGDGEGVVECETFSADVALKQR